MSECIPLPLFGKSHILRVTETINGKDERWKKEPSEMQHDKDGKKNHQKCNMIKMERRIIRNAT